MSLTLLRSAPAYGADVHIGTWEGKDVLVYLGPTVEGAVASSQARATELLEHTAEGLWPLLAVDEHEGRPAWLYPAHDGISAFALIARPPPMRVCLELALAVLARLQALEAEGLVHPGPLPSDVLIDAEGSVQLVGFVGPANADPTRVPPGDGSPEAHLAYRFGCLACQLLGATIPTPAGDDDSQRTRQRRVAIRIMSRPGPVIDESVRNELVRCLSFRPDERPDLDFVAAELRRSAGVLLQHPDLDRWAPAGIRECRSLTQASPRSTLELNAGDMLTDAEGTGTTDLFVDDDITAVSAGSTPGTYRRVELGSIPVTVGPPPEVARMRPSLPPDLFDDDRSVADEPELLEETTTMAARPVRPGIAIGFVLTTLLILALLAYLLS